MPGWPAVGRTDDQQLVETLRRADDTAPASLYDSYAERLNDYALSLLGDRDAAADAVHDALVTAHGSVDRLREPGRLRPWLYALARFQCAARTRGSQSSLPAPAQEDHDDPEERELAALVHESLTELGRQEREVLELSLRHDLSPGEAGSVLGLSSRQATARLARARDHLENAAAAVVLAKVGRAHCPDLSAMVDSWEGPLTPILRRRLSGHIGRCEVCIERRDRHVSAGRLLDMVPAAFPPLSLRSRVIETCVNPELEEFRASVVEAGGRFDRTGFPVAAESRAKGRGWTRRKGTGAKRARDEGSHRIAAAEPRRTAPLPVQRRRQRRKGPVVLAAACVLAATGAMVVVNGQDLTAGPSVNLRITPEPEPAMEILEPELDPGSPEPLPEDSPSEAPEPTLASRKAAVPTPLPSTARPTAGRRQVPQRSPSGRKPASRPAAAQLTVSCPSSIGEGAGRIQLAARNAAVSWSATTSGGLNVHPRRGQLKAGTKILIWVTAADPGESGAGRVAFKSAGGNALCAISWESPEPEVPDPPRDTTPPPAPTPTPSLSPESSSEAETG
ncbi:RNA polymerase sigma factor [Streptosporangium lutulentum]|uniref:RNA polymerase sigma factor (Sigma-70 family) n=1 Tax=Streptosporangium lutulentum TaxID=1461250 RepID=A0ABT9QT47_9ACTN|nr:sigma-70 family RNA polymerase sigma factor [Streptosporangium lutulentum]MDP9849925.1 RNA polymerase sigma factor (sigma-70 family) [Streptosporangium lutulentum]